MDDSASTYRQLERGSAAHADTMVPCKEGDRMTGRDRITGVSIDWQVTGACLAIVGFLQRDHEHRTMKAA